MSQASAPAGQMREIGKAQLYRSYDSKSTSLICRILCFRGLGIALGAAER